MSKSVDLWWRNPGLYIRELVECDERQIIFDTGYLINKRIDARKFLDLHYMGTPYKYRIMDNAVVREYISEQKNPVAVYPTWEYGDESEALERFLITPPGTDKAKCLNTVIPRDYRPIFGQPNVVYVTDLPDMTTPFGKKFLSQLKTLQSDYPESTIVPHGTFAAFTLLSLNFKALDFEVRQAAANGVIYLPTGKQLKVKHTSLIPYAKWLRLLGFLPVDMNDARKRCLFNIKSMRWAVKNYKDNRNIAMRMSYKDADSTSSDEDFEPAVAGRFITKNIQVQPGDRYVCNSCSLQYDCKLYREGSVCTLPKSEPGQLAKHFGTRNANDIIDGLGALVQINAGRAALGVEQEEDFGLDPNVTKIIDDTFRQGTKLAQLIDPNLRSAKVQVNIGQSAGVINNSPDMSSVVSSAVRELERAGIKREDITPEMIEGVLAKSGNLPELPVGERVYDAEVVE